MTTREVLALHAAVEARRRARNLAIWQVALEMDLGYERVRLMRHGVASPATRTAAEAWLRRHTDPPSTTHESEQGGNDHDDGGSGG